jgi:hypothetical protein
MSLRGTKEWKENISRAKQGQVSWNKGITYSVPKMTGKNSWNWKGINVSYRNLHRWVERCLGKPDTCEHCGKTGLFGKHIQWANKSHQYKRDLSDWLRLCAPCHSIYDRN